MGRRRWLSGGLVTTAVALALPALAAVEWWTESGLVKVFQDAPAGRGRELRLQAARGEVEWAQVALRSPAAATVSFAASDLAGPRGAMLPRERVAFHPAVYVHVARSSGNGFKAPADWPEILPAGDKCDLKPNANQAVYIELGVPPNAAPGSYRGCVSLTTAGQEPIRVPLRLTVWPLTIPTTPTMRTSYYIWWEGLEKRYGLQAGTPRRREVLDRFFWFLVDHRLCPMSLPCDIRQGEPYMQDRRVNGVRLPYVGTDQEMAGVIKFVRDRGWLDRCFYYMFDEPSKRVWHEVKDAATRILSFDPAMARLDTIQPEPELQGQVSLWCPNVESVYLYDDRLAAACARGEEVWWYTCAAPLFPYPTFLLDDDAIAPRVLFWMQARYDLTGSLYINTIHWGGEGEDPWREAVASPELKVNNDGLLMYTSRGPGEVFPVTGVRLEMIRDGIEDFELLQLLRRAVAEAARRLDLPDPEGKAREMVTALASEAVPDARHCERDPRKLLALRAKAARLAIELQRDPGLLARLPAMAPHTVAEPEVPDRWRQARSRPAGHADH